MRCMSFGAAFFSIVSALAADPVTTRRAAAPRPPQQVVIHNEARAYFVADRLVLTTIVGVYSTPTGYGYWGRNLAPGSMVDRILGLTEGIPRGRSASITYDRPQGCLYDFRVVYGLGLLVETETEEEYHSGVIGPSFDLTGWGEEERFGVNICDNPTVVFNGENRRSSVSEGPARAEATRHRFVLVNRFNHEIRGVFVSNEADVQDITEVGRADFDRTWVRNWSGNLLPARRSIRPGQSMTLAAGNHCVVALRVNFGGREAERLWGVDLCGRPRLTLGPDVTQERVPHFIEYSK